MRSHKKRRIYTYGEYVWDEKTQRYERVKGEYYDYEGPVALAMDNPTWQYEHWRFRNDDGTLSTATWIADENVAPTTIRPGQVFRLRVNFGDTNAADSNNTNISVKLQYNVGGAGWNDLTTNTADAVYLTSSSQSISDGDGDTTQRLSNMTGSTFTGTLSTGTIDGGTY